MQFQGNCATLLLYVHYISELNIVRFTSPHFHDRFSYFVDSDYCGKSIINKLPSSV